MPPFLPFVSLLCKILAELPGHAQIVEANLHHHHLCYCQGDSKVLQRIDHFTVVDGSEAEGDLVLIQTFLLYYVNQVILMLTSIFQEQFP